MSNTDISLKPGVKQFGILTYECYMIYEIVVRKCRKLEDSKSIKICNQKAKERQTILYIKEKG